MHFFGETDYVHRHLPLARAHLPASASFLPQIKINSAASPAASSFP